MKVAVVQMSAGQDRRRNIDKACRLVSEAARQKANWVLLPEAFSFRGRIGKDLSFHELAEGIPGESTEPLCVLAGEKKIFILAGTVCEKIPGRQKAYNTSVLIDPRGKVAAAYRKRHLFDAVLGRQRIREALHFVPGSDCAVARVKDFVVGMTICYDLRFADLYQCYVREKCQVITVPSSFTQKTGEAHWEVLVRARAIETQSYVLAPNQVGRDSRGVRAYGNSMIVSPWGRVLARARGTTEEIIFADIKKSEAQECRRRLPSFLQELRKGPASQRS